MIWAQWLLVTWLLIFIGRRSRITAALLALLALIPIHDVSLAMALRGLWGDPSVTTLQLLLLACIDKLPTPIRYGWRLPAFVALAGMTLYVSALGPWDPDLYRLGYQPLALTAVLAIGAMLMWWRGYSLCLWLLTIDLLAWRYGVLESRNLWDTLLDPLLMFAMLALALRNGYRAQRNKKILLARS